MSIERFGEYQLLKKLATGGMAEIWLARQQGLAMTDVPPAGARARAQQQIARVRKALHQKAARYRVQSLDSLYCQ